MEFPKITKMEVVPVAGYDSMSMTLSGAHAPYFTRNIVVLHDNSGNVGIGEVHGGKKTTDELNSFREIVVGTSIHDYKNTLNRIRIFRLDKSSEGIQYLDIAKLSDVVLGETAIESALLDLWGKFLNKPLCSLIGEGKQRSEIDILGYLFYVSDRNKTDLPYLDENDSSDEWFKMRRNEMLTKESIVAQAKALKEKYGFNSFKLKGGVLDPDYEMEAVKALKEEFPEANINIDPNGAWDLTTALRLTEKYGKYLSYIEDPCLGEKGYSGREILSEYKSITGLKIATNMIATDWRQLYHAISERSIDIVLADPHFWTMEGSVRVSQVLRDFRVMTWGSHSNNHFDISLAMFAQTAAAACGEVTPLDTHWIWQDGQNLCDDSYEIQNGKIIVTDKPGIGVNINFEKLEEANRLFNSLPEKFKSRDDSVAMQYLIKDWKFDSKKPCLVR